MPKPTATKTNPITSLNRAVVESFGALWFGPEHAVTLSFTLLILMLLFRPSGLLGRTGYA